MNWWVYSNWFRGWGWVEDFDPKKYPSDEAGTKPIALSEPIVGWMVAATKANHRQTILVPYSDRMIRERLKAFVHLTYCFIEPDAARFRSLCLDESVEHDTGKDIYQIDTMWNMTVDQWVEKFEPGDGVVDNMLMNGPPEDAAADLIQLLPYLFANAEFAVTAPLTALRDKAFRAWCGKKKLCYHLPLRTLMVKGEPEYAILTGKKEWEEK